MAAPDRSVLEAHRDAGRSKAEVARLMGVDPVTVRNWCIKLGVDARVTLSAVLLKLRLVVVVAAVLAMVGVVVPVGTVEASPLVRPNSPLRIKVDEAVGGKTVIGQLTVARANKPGFVTAWDCSLPRPVKSDVNYDGAVDPIASNRLIVTANSAGEVCFYTLEPVAIIVDVFAVTDGITAIDNQRVDTRTSNDADGCLRTPVYNPAGDLIYATLFCGPAKAGEVLEFQVREAIGGKTVIGQLTVAQTTGPGFVTAYGCADGIPRGADGKINKSDLNYDGRINPVASNRLIVKADAQGFVCFYTLDAAHLVVDINGIADANAITPFDNRRTDTREPEGPASGGCRPVQVIDPDTGGVINRIVCEGDDTRHPADSTLLINVPQAVGGKTVVGQLTMTQAQGAGFFTAYGCANGIPRSSSGDIAKSDLNFSNPSAVSNRLIVEADANGDICIYTLVASHIVVDINGIFDTIDAFPNQRTDTRDNASTGSNVPPGCRVEITVNPDGSTSSEVVCD